MTTLFAIVGLYFLVLIMISYIAKRRIKKNAEDFFLASRTLGPFVLTFTTFATLFSAFTVLGMPGLVFKTGLGFWLALPLGNALFTVFIGLLLRSLPERPLFWVPFSK